MTERLSSDLSVTPSTGTPSAAPQVRASALPPATERFTPIIISHENLKRSPNLFRAAYFFVFIVPWILYRLGEAIFLKMRFHYVTTPEEHTLFERLKSLNVDLHDASLQHHSTGLALKRLVHNWSRFKDREGERINHTNFLFFSGTQKFTFTMWKGKTIVTLHNRVGDHAEDGVKVKRAVVIDNETGEAELMYEKRGRYQDGAKTVLTPTTESVHFTSDPISRPFKALVVRGDATREHLTSVFGPSLDDKYRNQNYRDRAYVAVEFDYGAQGPVNKLIRVGQTIVPGYTNRRACHVGNVLGWREIEGQLCLVFADSLGGLHTKQEYIVPLSELNMGHEFVIYRPKGKLYGVEADTYSQTLAEILLRNVNADYSHPYSAEIKVPRRNPDTDTFDWGYAFISCGMSPFRSNTMGPKGKGRLAQSLFYHLRGERMKIPGSTSIEKEFCSPFSLRAAQTALIFNLLTPEESTTLQELATRSDYAAFTTKFAETLTRILTENPGLETDSYFWKDSRHITPASYFSGIAAQTATMRQLPVAEAK